MKLEKGFKNTNRPETATPAVPEHANAATQPACPAPKSAPGGRIGKKNVTIEAKIDVGFGNRLYLRGEGRGLSWNRGVPLNCIDSSTWKWTGEVADKLRFKLLLNDAIWAKGEDLVVKPGEKMQVAPAF